MIRQRISTHGQMREMEPSTEIPCLNIPPTEICRIHSGPTKRWLAAKQKWDTIYAKQKIRVQHSRGKEYIDVQKRGFLGGDLEGEFPPPSALAGRPSTQIAIAEDEARRKKNKNLAGWAWAMMGGKEDRRKEASKKVGNVRVTGPAVEDDRTPGV